jgi:hypothetical protein
VGRRNYALERGGPKRLHLRWRFRHRGFQVTLDQGPAWTIERPSLLAGTTLVLPDGSSLHVRWVKRRWYSIGMRDELRVERDGVPVPGSDGDPRVIGRQVGGLLLVLALLRLLLFAIALPSTRAPSNLIGLVLEGGAVLVLGVLAWSGVRTAALIAAVLFGLEAVVALVAAPGATVIQALIAAHLIRAWRKMKPRARIQSLREIFE